MPASRSLLALAGAIGLAALAAGCRSETADPVARRPSLEVDPCAERLHDLSGRLLLYWSAHRRLPATLDALPALDPAHPTPTVCPVSGEPYAYYPEGVAVAARAGRLVLADPLPSHAGMRWGVFLEKAAGGIGLTARVILVPADLIPPPSAAPPTADTPPGP